MVRDQVERRGVRDPRVLEAMRAVPRHLFLSGPEQSSAYDDTPLPIGCRQTISQPYIVGYMTEALAPRDTETILEIGTGSGYQTAILACLAQKVLSIERIPELADRARENLRVLGIDNAEVLTGDGTAGWPDRAPFDAILITAGTPAVPQPLLGAARRRRAPDRAGRRAFRAGIGAVDADPNRFRSSPPDRRRVRSLDRRSRLERVTRFARQESLMSSPVISVRDLRKTYVVTERESGVAASLASLLHRKTEKIPAVDGISFEMNPGEMVGFLGPNGAGKTTTLKMLSGLLHPSAGTIAVLGHNPSETRKGIPPPDHARHGPAQPAGLGHPGDGFLRTEPGRLRHSRRRFPPDARRADRTAGAGAAVAQTGAQSFAGGTDEMRDRRRAAPPAAGGLPRRADDRIGCDHAAPDPRLPRRIQQPVRRDRPAHQPLHGGCRGALPARDRHPPRPPAVRRRPGGPGAALHGPQDNRRAAGGLPGGSAIPTEMSFPARRDPSPCASPRPRRPASPAGSSRICR